MSVFECLDCYSKNYDQRATAEWVGDKDAPPLWEPHSEHLSEALTQAGEGQQHNPCNVFYIY